ncbi:MAG: hypothetical protein J6U94_06775 [Paludibacteraceae bacterium]|nr:hypothetical protein [Paludibacteraceae bacterium]
MLFLLFCFLLFIGFLISSVLRILFSWFRLKKHTTPSSSSSQLERQRKKFDATDAEDVEYEEIKE